MGITLIEQIGIIAGIVIGVSGFIYSVVQARRQREQNAKQEAHTREQEAHAREQEAKHEAFEREQAAKYEALGREQAAKHEAFEREQAAKHEAFLREQAAEQAVKQAEKDRLYFLANLIVDKNIPRVSRQIFFDEYIAKGGNGSFVKFWYDEGKELETR